MALRSPGGEIKLHYMIPLLECMLVAVPHVSWAFWKTSCLFQKTRPQGRFSILFSDNRNFLYTPASKRSCPEKGTSRHRQRTRRTDRPCWRDRGNLAVETCFALP